MKYVSPMNILLIHSNPFSIFYYRTILLLLLLLLSLHFSSKDFFSKATWCTFPFVQDFKMEPFHSRGDHFTKWKNKKVDEVKLKSQKQSQKQIQSQMVIWSNGEKVCVMCDCFLLIYVLSLFIFTWICFLMFMLFYRVH
jgi:hypothetical protein